MRKLKIAGAVLSAVAVTLLAGCGADDGPNDETMPGTSAPSDSAAASDNANQADVTFAQSMIPHHEQAIDMAELVEERSDNPEVIALAKQIEQAQDPEVNLLERWLEQWGASEQMQHGSGHAGMSGMMSAKDMGMLEHATGAEFDRMWLRMMIEHHEGAIAMARTELDNGSNDDAKTLARQIIDAQQAEIDTMTKLLNKS